MKKLKDIMIEDLFNHKAFPYIYFLVVVAFLHIASFEVFGDDYAVLAGLKDNLWLEIKNLPNICNGWSGRYLINPLIYVMMHFDYRVWFCVEMICFVLMYQLIKKYGLMSDKVPHLFVLSAMMCTLSFVDYYEIGWRVSTMTYIWVAASFMVACLTIVKNYKDENIKWYQMIGILLMTIFSTNKEELSVMGIIIFGVALVMALVKKRRYIVFLVQLGISVGNFLWHLLSPNNQARYERKSFYGAHDYGFFDKVTIGLSSTFRHIVFEHNFAFLCLVIVLIVVVWFATKKILPRFLSFIPLAFWFMTWIPEFDYIFGTCSVGFRAWVVIICGALALLAIVLCMYYIYGKNEKFIWMTTILVAGFAGRVVVGFANTGWQRYERTYTFLYIAMIVVASVLACDIWKNLTYRKKQLLFGVIITLGNFGVMKNIYDLGII